MMYTLKLSSRLGTCPKCWAGFINMLKVEVAEEDKINGGFTTEMINKYLEPYNADYINDETTMRNAIVKFKNKEDAVVFKLAFGL